jgi:hypothetical protein
VSRGSTELALKALRGGLARGDRHHSRVVHLPYPESYITEYTSIQSHISPNILVSRVIHHQVYWYPQSCITEYTTQSHISLSILVSRVIYHRAYYHMNIIAQWRSKPSAVVSRAGIAITPVLFTWQRFRGERNVFHPNTSYEIPQKEIEPMNGPAEKAE